MLMQAYYHDMTEDEIAGQISGEGLRPVRVVEAPGSIYNCHKNLNDLLLAFVLGSADITIGGRCYHCLPGDRLLIKGDILHSAIVGTSGCVYWMTQLPVLAD